MSKVKLWSVAKGKMVDYSLSADHNNEIVAEHGSVEKGDYEFLKFPGDVSKSELKDLFEVHNEAHKGIKGLSEEDLAEQEERKQVTQDLVDSFGK